MIYRIVNRAEVEQGIRERGIRDAEMVPLRQIIFSTAAAADAAIFAAVFKDAEVTPHAEGIAKWNNLPALERMRLGCIYFAAYHIAAELRADEAMQDITAARVKLLECRVCGAQPTEQHDGHPFTCPHGEEVESIGAFVCIEDHPDVPPYPPVVPCRAPCWRCGGPCASAKPRDGVSALLHPDQHTCERHA